MAISGVISGVMSGGGIANLILGIYPPLSTAYSKLAYSFWANMIPGLGDLIELEYRDELPFDTYLKFAEQNGFNKDWASKLHAAGTTLLSAGDYIRLWRRGKIDEEWLNDTLAKLRFSPGAIDHLKKVTEFFPSPMDLVRFAVREVYTPETVAKFGQMEDIPGKYLEESKKAGLPVDQANNFWASHWELPSTLQGFAMLHRDIIDEDTLKMLLKSLDVMPFWRDMLIQLSYNPLTRVDVRRMHAMGILEPDDVAKAYRHGGYSPENAELMKEFTLRYNADTGTGLTRASVQKSYKIGLITKKQMRTFFESFGYAPDVVEYWVDMTEYEKSLAEVEALKTELFLQYRVGSITLEDVRRKLGYAGLPAVFTEAAIKEETEKPSEKLKMPSRSDLETWLELQIIDEGIYAEQMKALGYRQTDVENYLTVISLKVDTSLRKYLPIKTYQRWLKANILSEGDFSRIAGDMRISEADIGRLIIEVMGE